MGAQSSFKVVIIGAGLSGSLLANGLMRHDIDVHVYERLPANSKREGYQIRLGAAALKGMRACLSQDQLDRIVQKFGRASGSKSEAPIIYDHHFNKMLDLSTFPTYNKSAPISRVILRDALSEPVEAAGKLTYGCQLNRYEILKPGTDEERVRVWFEDGSYDDCDVLIGADGSHSKINKELGLDNIAEIKSHVSMIAKNELPTKRYLELDPRISKMPIMSFADKKSVYFCAYLPEGGDKDDGVSEQNFDESLSSSFFGLHVPTEEAPENLASMPTEQKWEFVTDSLKSWAPEYKTIIDLVRGCDLYVYKGRVAAHPGLDWRAKVRSKTTPELGHPRVWLCGDAMHAMLPNRGMGGNTAMCDTATALPLLVRLANLSASQEGVENGEVAKACSEFEAEMMPRAFEWVKKSGGSSIVPIDSSTYSGRAFFILAATVMNFASLWYSLVGLFTSQKFVDEAPELTE